MLADVMRVLGIVNVTDTRNRLDRADLGTTEVRSGGQRRHLYIVNESGLYDVVLDSRKPEARRFRRPLRRSSGACRLPAPSER